MHQQIYGHIIDDMTKKIKNGVYKSGEKIPTEKELCKIYNASQSTIKKALKELIRSNYIESRERVGNYVKVPSISSYNINFDYTTLGFRTERMTHTIESPKAVHLLSPLVEAEKGTRAIRFDEAFKEDGEILCRTILYIYYKKGATPQSDWKYEESSQFMARYSGFCNSSKMSISTIYPNAEMIKNLELKEGTLYYEIRRLDFDDYGKEMGCSVAYIEHSHICLEAYS